MAITISTHNGSTVSLGHNRRIPQMIAAENEKWAAAHPGELRIDPNGVHEAWKDGDLKNAYERLFGQAIEAYNKRQKESGHKDRIISNYLESIRAKERESKNAKHPLYEIIYSVGNREHPVEETVSKAILKEMAAGFQKRNPHLYMLTAHFHADENGQQHVHVTYIPVATGCKRGPAVQNSLSAALRQQGIAATGIGDTEQMAWERRENLTLEMLCNQYGYEVEHPERGTKQEHLSVESFKMQQEMKNTQAKLEKLSQLPAGRVIISKARLEQLEETESTYKKDLKMVEEYRTQNSKALEAMKAYSVAYKSLKERTERFEQEVNAAANRKLAEVHDRAIEFIKAKGLWQEFKDWVRQCLRHVARE